MYRFVWPTTGASLQFAVLVNKKTNNRQRPATRSETRIPRLRTRGRENRRRMMAAAERLLLEADGRPLRFSEVFEAAGVSRGSAYRIYMGVDDLIQDLATAWANNFVAFLESAEPAAAPENWGELADFIVRKAADYWILTTDTMRVLPRIRSYEPSSYREAIHALSEVNALLFDRYFIVPGVPGWLAKMAFFARICDITFGDALRVDGAISEQRVVEAQALCRAYLAFYLPASLPRRDPAEA
jgi:AcrR family transcriptional regulator